MINWALEVEYDGTPFMGWQRQKHGLTVQQVIEDAAAKLCSGNAPIASAAGRTDAGVHALGQIVQIDLPDFPPHRIREAMNYHMKPHPVAVLRAAPAPLGWSARFSAIHRRYRYIISNRAALPILRLNRVWHVARRLDESVMHRAAQSLVGHHDFSAFRAAACQAKSPMRTLDSVTVHRLDEDIIIEAGARSFLHHQVRNIVGSLKLVGEGRWPEQKIAEVLTGRDRALAGPTAPAAGLYFADIHYEIALNLG